MSSSGKKKPKSFPVLMSTSAERKQALQAGIYISEPKTGRALIFYPPRFPICHLVEIVGGS